MKYSVVIPVKIDHEWQRLMTECALGTLRATTHLPFEIVLVECKTEHFQSWALTCPDFRYLHIDEPTTANDELNQGVRAAEGDFVIYTGNDIFMRPGWLEALQQCFDECRDCGIATLASGDLRGKLPIAAEHWPCDKILEGVYGPLMMFERGWEFDAATFPANFCDSDLVMRVYESGKRSYRNYSVVLEHLNQQTTRGSDHDKDFNEARQRFIAKHQDSSLMMFQYLAGGQII